MPRKSRAAARIAALNDAFRKKLVTRGRVHITAGVSANGPDYVCKALVRVMAFDEFTPDNDPYGEHDFGGFELDGDTLFWKIDYYDPSGQFQSEDPSDASRTLRVLTIMLADEY